MRHDRLPDGFGVRIDPRVRTYSGGRFLVGGSPTRVLRLPADAAARIGDGYLEVTDAASAAIARRLLDCGVANPRPQLLPSLADVTVVVPHDNDPLGLQRVLATLRGHPVLVVDDGSDRPVRILRGRNRCRVTVLRSDQRQGKAAARNIGLRAATTEYVAYVDSSAVPRPGWLEVMLGHFSDPQVALVAPRILPHEPDTSVLGRYERTRSALDRGRRETAVTRCGSVPDVPGVALLVRRRALLAVGGFDEQLSGADDIDMCWRLQRCGWRLRYEPAAQVTTDTPVSLWQWLARKASRGADAAPVVARPTGAPPPPLAVSPWLVVSSALLATFSRWGTGGALVTVVTAVLRARRTFVELDNPLQAAVVQVVREFGVGARRMASVLCRQYWPVTVLAALVSGRLRRVAVTMAVADGLVDWFTHRDADGLDPLRYLACKRLDDLAYGAGLWWAGGAAAGRQGSDDAMSDQTAHGSTSGAA